MERLDSDIKNTLQDSVDGVEVPAALYAAARLAACTPVVAPVIGRKRSIWTIVRHPAAWTVAAAFAVVAIAGVAAPDVVQAGVRKLMCTMPGAFCGAKNEPKAVESIIANLRQEVPFLYELTAFGDLNLARYSADEGIVTLHYRVPKADTIDNYGNAVQGFLFVREYEKGAEAKSDDSRFSPSQQIKPAEPSKTFDVSGTRWAYYDRFTGTATTQDGRKGAPAESGSLGIHPVVRGERGGFFYEMELQGSFTDDTLVDVLRHFHPSGK